MKDSPIFDFHANFYDGRANIPLELIYPCFGPFNKSNIHGFLCFTIFLEGGHLGRNDLGDPSFSLGPSNKTYQEENLKTPMNSLSYVFSAHYLHWLLKWRTNQLKT